MNLKIFQEPLFAAMLVVGALTAILCAVLKKTYLSYFAIIAGIAMGAILISTSHSPAGVDGLATYLSPFSMILISMAFGHRKCSPQNSGVEK
jgi:drug/metabolite transporter (DMT)-like permease